MNIAILRTEQADRECSYNKVEYPAAYRGIRIVGYVDAHRRGTEFRGHPVIAPGDLARLGIDLVVSASPLTPAISEQITGAGWSAERLLSFATDAQECLKRWNEAMSPWLSHRSLDVVEGRRMYTRRQIRMDGPATENIPTHVMAGARAALTERLLMSFCRAKDHAPASGPFAVDHMWREGLKHARPNFYRAVANLDVAALDELLASFFRNELTIGMFGGREGYLDFVKRGAWVLVELRQQFNVWKNSVTSVDMNRVGSPAVGNPYGVWVGNQIVHPNTLMNDYRAEHVLGLMSGVERPIVLDLGGGFGGFAHQLMTQRSDVVYVGFDLPENLLVASYFLLASHPGRRVLLYSSQDQPLDRDTLNQYDIVMMPNFMLPRIPDRTIDAFVNFMSLSEMPYETICGYLCQVDRICRGFFYHENVLDNGDYNDFYPESAFPALTNFTRLSRAPSRWPYFSPSSPAHCHGEFLLVRSDIEQQRYLHGRGQRGRVAVAA